MQPTRVISGLGDRTAIDINLKEVLIGRWISQSGNAISTNADMLTELEILGQATATLPTAGSEYDFVGGVPYTTRLRNIREWKNRLSDSQDAYLRSILFYILDTTKNGSPYQDAAVLAEIMTPSDPFNVPARANYLNSELPVTWMPNGFNPVFKINGVNILQNFTMTDRLQSSDSGNAALLSMGLTLPTVFDDLYYRPQQGFKNIDVEAYCVQPVLTKYQRYCVVCEATFVI